MRGVAVRRVPRLASFTFGALFFLLSSSPLIAQNPNNIPYPRLANYYLVGEIRDMDVEILSGWDLIVCNWSLDRSEAYRENLENMKSLNPDLIYLAYCLSIGVNSTLEPPDPLYTMAQEYNWWLYDYQGNRLSDGGNWDFNKLLNFTNSQAAHGIHPEGSQPNRFLPEEIIRNHIEVYDFWDGIFWDVFSDNLRHLHADIKDATVNQVAEYDYVQNESEPLFDDIWCQGMISMVEYTMSLKPDVLMVGNGLHRTTLSYLNGRMQEDYHPSTIDLSDLASVQRYLVETRRNQPISIINGMAFQEDPTDYVAMRFSLASALLLGAYLSFDFGSQDHGETIWYDEYSVKPGGEVSAVVTDLAEGIDAFQDRVPVSSTSGFPNSGVILIDGEQIHYTTKTPGEFTGCLRGYPRVGGKYDLRKPHEAGATVIHHDNSHTGYLGLPVTDAFDPNEPSVRLKDLFAEAGWYATGERADDINARVWRRDFENGIVLLNASSESRTVGNLGDGSFRKIQGIQDPAHNDGAIVRNSLVIPPEDAYLLLRINDRTAPEPPNGVTRLE